MFQVLYGLAQQIYMCLQYLYLVAEAVLPVFQFGPVDLLGFCACKRVFFEFLTSLQEVYGIYLSLIGLIRALQMAVNHGKVYIV